MASKKKATPQTDPFVWLSDKLRGTGEMQPVGKIHKNVSGTKTLAPKKGTNSKAEARRRSINVSSAKRHQNKKRPK